MSTATDFTNVRFLPPAPSSSSSSSYRTTIINLASSKRPRQKKSVDYKDRKAVKARHLSRIFPPDWFERFAAEGVSWDSPDAYAMYLRVHQRLCDDKFRSRSEEMGVRVGVGNNGKQRESEASQREEAMRGTLSWISKEGGEFVRQQGLKPNNSNNNDNNSNNVDGRTSNGIEIEIEDGGITCTTNPLAHRAQLISTSTSTSTPIPLPAPAPELSPLPSPLPYPRGTLAYLVSRSYDPSSYVSHSSHTSTTATNIQGDKRKRKRRCGSSRDSGSDSSASGNSRGPSSSGNKRRRDRSDHGDGDGDRDGENWGRSDNRNGTLPKPRKKYWELQDRVIWVDRDLGYGALFDDRSRRKDGGRSWGSGWGSIGGRAEESEETETVDEGEEEVEHEQTEAEAEVREVRFYRSGRVVVVDKQRTDTVDSGPTPDDPGPSRPRDSSEEEVDDDDDAASDSSSSIGVKESDEQPSFESTWTLRVSYPGQEDHPELDLDRDPLLESPEYILHVSHLAPCLPNKQTAERLLSDILLGVPSLPPVQTVCPNRIVDARADLLAEVNTGPEDVITITPSLNDPKDAFPLGVIPRDNRQAIDCTCRVDQLGFDGVWFQVPSSSLDVSRDFQTVLNQVLHGPSRLLGRRLTVMLRDVHYWIDRGLPSMTRYISDHSKWIQALGCRAIPVSAPDPCPTTSTTTTDDTTVTTFYPAGGFDERPAALVPRVLTVGHGFILWATPVSGNPAQQWTVDVVGPGTTLVIPFERRIVMFHLTDSSLIETEACHYQMGLPLRKVLARREEDLGPNAFMSDEATSQIFLAIERMTESVQAEDRTVDYIFTRRGLLEVCDTARKLASRSQKRRFIAQKEKLTVALEQKRSKGGS